MPQIHIYVSDTIAIGVYATRVVSINFSLSPSLVVLERVAGIELSTLRWRDECFTTVLQPLANFCVSFLMKLEKAGLKP